MQGEFDLTTAEGIAAAETDLAAFQKKLDDGSFVTSSLLPWGLLAGRRRMEIESAKKALVGEPL